MTIKKGICPACGYSYEECSKLEPVQQTPPCCGECYHPILGVKSGNQKSSGKGLSNE